MKKVLIGGMIFSAVLSLAAEKVAISGTDTKSINADMQAAQPVSSDLLQSEFDKYAAERKISYGTPNAKGTTYFTGSSSVAADVSSADFIKSRSNAYSKAYNDAIAAVIMDRFGKEFVKTVREEFSDESTNAQEIPKNPKEAASTLKKKAAALAEAKIDEKLKAMGIDPNNYADKSVAAKKDLYRNSIVSSTFRKAFGSAAGCLPVQTFESRAADGVYSIGVVLRNDAICSEVARCIAKKERPTLSRPSGIPVKDALPTDEEMITQFGVRLFFDENGEPALLSFGQWASNYRGNNSRAIDRAARHALMQAKNVADEQLTKFINSTIRVEETSLRGEEELEQMVLRNDGNVSREAMVNIIDKWSTRSETVGYDTMIGRSTVYSKMLQHPSGHRIGVVVRCWSFGKLDAEKSVIESTKKSRPVSVPSVKNENSGVRRGKSYDF